MPTIWKRIAVYGALAAAAGLVAWLQFRAAAPPDGAGLAPASASRAADSAQALRETARDPFRLGPDVRVLMAAGDLHRLITGEPLEDARADSTSGGWRVVHRGVVVGALPEFPEFDDLERLLRKWALSLGARDSFRAVGRRASRAIERASIAERIERLEATAAADLADRLWSAGRRDPALLGLAAHALTLLAVQTVDAVGGADRVTARALAVAAASAALDSVGARRDAALLADVMGYAASAWERSAALAEDDAVRLFVRREDRALEKQAGRRDASRAARFLALKRIARRHDLDGWRRWLERYFPDDPTLALALTSTSLEIGRFEAHLPAAIQVLSGVVQDLRMIGEVEEGELPGGIESLEEMIREFERLMSVTRPMADGAFLDAPVLCAYYRTCFYSALTILGEHMRQSLSSVPDTRAFADGLGAGDEGVAGEFQRWFTHLANAKLGRPELAALRKDLQAMPHFGAPLLLRTYQALQEHSPAGDLGLRVAARRIARSLDSRPMHLVAFASIVRRDVFDIERAETLFAHGVRASGPQERGLSAWWARYNGDAAALERMLDAPDLSPADQAELLEDLAAVPGVDSSAVAARWERALGSNRRSWELLDGYTRFVRARGEWRRAEKALERWLERESPGSDPFEEIFARTRLARNFADQGEYGKAIEAVEPVVESQQFGAMDCMVELLEKTGELARAETLAVRAWARYPDSPKAQARVVGLCWRQGKDALAARMLAEAPTKLAVTDFRADLAQRFLECFRARPARGIRAAEALLAAGAVPPVAMMALAAELDEAGEHRLAFEVQSRIPGEGQAAVSNLGWSHHYLWRWKGEDAALAWLRPRLAKLGPRDRALLAMVGYQSRDFDLLWEVDDVGPDRSNIEFHWMLRAAAAVRLGPSRGPHRARLERYYARPGTERYALLGRFLLGRESAAAALASIVDPRSRCETYYYLGLAAQARGAIREASRWYARCIETGQSYNGEYHWAYLQLHEWVAKEASLARLEAAARGAPFATLAP